MILVDCFGNDVLEYTAKDEFLKDFALDKDGRLCRTIVSPAQVKGLEFDAVILYKFGASALEASLPLAERINAVLSGGVAASQPLEERNRLPFEYFFNRLYVAASRAKKSLLIVDTREGFDKFWAALVPREGGIDKPSHVDGLPWARDARLKNCQTLDDRLELHMSAGDFDSAWKELTRDDESLVSRAGFRTLFERTILEGNIAGCVLLLTRALPLRGRVEGKLRVDHLRHESHIPIGS